MKLGILDIWKHFIGIIHILFEIHIIYIIFIRASATLMLIGSKGETVFETMFTIFALCFTVGIFAYILNNISGILTEIN